MEMKKRIKKIGVLAVLLANVAIFAPKEAEGQKTTGGCTSIKIDCPGIGTGDRLVCVRGGDIEYSCNCGDMSPCFGGWWWWRN
jgi:hypothetical protein